jgi:hypothetical protein
MQSNDSETDPREVIVLGLGEVGRRIAEGARRAGDSVRELRRGDSLSDTLSAVSDRALVVLAMREDDLEGPLREALARCPSGVIVLQNGWIDELLEGREVTRAVLWFTAKGDFFASARESVVGGPHAQRFARWALAAGAPCRVVSPDDARREAREKAAWSCLVGPGVAAYGVTFAEMLALDEHTARRIVEEACEVASRALGEEVSKVNAWRMVTDTVGALGWMRGGSKGLAWRSGRVVRWAEETLGDGMAAVRNAEVLRLLAAKG